MSANHNTNPEYQLVVPTRDSARWIGQFFEAYREIGVSPLYLVDTRTADRTAGILSALGAEILPVTPTADRVESMISVISTLVEKEWVLRLDDDEFPSVALIRWLGSGLSTIRENSVAISRRDCLLSADGQVLYSRLEDYYWESRDYSFLCPQWRLYRHKSVNYTSDLHTPGFIVRGLQFAPPDCHFVHFDWILRSFAERQEKLEQYERQSKGKGRPFARYYLPELHHPRDLRLARMESSEFTPLAHSIARLSLSR